MAVDAQDRDSLSSRLEQLGISQAEFAAICDVTAKTVNNWVKGRTRVNPTALAFLEQIEASANYVGGFVSATGLKARRAASRSPRAIPIGSAIDAGPLPSPEQS